MRFQVRVKSTEETYWHSSLFQLNMQEERQINNLALQAILSSNKEKTVAYQIKKLRKSGRKADPMIVFSEFDVSYSDSGLEDWKIGQTLKAPKSARSQSSTGNSSQNAKDSEPQEDTRPWYQRHMWLLMIGGMIVYNIMTFDKSKLQEAMDAAKQQAGENGTAR